jgi:hypothetical protein
MHSPWFLKVGSMKSAHPPFWHWLAAAGGADPFHDGAASRPGSSVSRVWSDPSAFITYTSQFPSRYVEKAILLPSGENEGAVDLGEGGGFAAVRRPFHFEGVALDGVGRVKIAFEIAAHF